MKPFLMASTALWILFYPAGTAQAEAPVNDCDRLAAHPADGDRVAPGVQWDLMDARGAIRACTEAVAQHPDTLRFQFQLGRALLRAKRRDEGLPYLFAAAENGYAAAFANIGGTYEFDLGNFSEALKWYRRGAEFNDQNSQTHLAEMYLEGKGVKRDLGEALKWYTPAANSGYPLAEYKIGLIYQRGDHKIKKNLVTALSWIRKAADHGFARAQNDLGWAYESGQGTRRDYTQAAQWYLKAAKQGWALAQVNIARFYEHGRGVDSNLPEAFYWYRMASGARLEKLKQKAIDGASRLRHRISQSQIASANARVNEARGIKTALANSQNRPPATSLPAKVATAPRASAEVDSNYRPGQASSPEVDTAYVPAGVSKPAPAPAPIQQQPKTAAVAPAATAPAGAGSAMPEFEPIIGNYVAVANVNVRSGPGAANKKIDIISAGGEVMVLGKVKGRDWMLVALPNKSTGYVHAELLTASTGGGSGQTVAAKSASAEQSSTKTVSLDSSLSKKASAIKSAGIDFGSYHALVIGNNKYKDLPELETAVNDAKTVATILGDDYGFNVNLLLDATRADIIIALDNYRKTLGDSDNLLIYYAGHGILDYSSERGYWLPVDASPDTQVSWVSNATITDTLKAMNAKHVMLVVDSCYSGTLTRSVKSTLQSPEYLKKMIKKRARVVLASGGLEPVADGGGGEHSVFAKAFINALRENENYLDGTELFLQVRRPVMLNAMQTPEYSDIRLSGHDGGDFIFVKK